MRTFVPASGIDRVGFWLSSACAVHCALMPFVISLLPLIGLEVLGGTGAEIALVACASSIGLLSVAYACVRLHRRVLPLALVACGILSVLAARLRFERSPLETGFAAIGGALIAGGHATNWRLCHRRACSPAVRPPA